jgi:hypothetical protein
MENERKLTWQELCAQAAVEQDSDKLLALVTEINRLLDPSAAGNAKPTE